MLCLIFSSSLTYVLNAQTDLDYPTQGFPANYDTIFLNESIIVDTCTFSANLVSSVVRFDLESVVELNFSNGTLPSNLTLTLSSGVGATIYPDSIAGNRVFFDHLQNDKLYTLRGFDHCANNTEISTINTSAMGSKDDVVIVSNTMIAALEGFHRQDTNNVKNIVEFLTVYPGLSRLETLSYLQNILRNGDPIDRNYYDRSDPIIYTDFSLLFGTGDDDVDPDPDPDPDPWDFDERYCTCRIAQSNFILASPADIVPEGQKLKAMEMVQNKGFGGLYPAYYTTYHQAYWAKGPARYSRLFRKGVYQAERRNEVLSNLDTSQVINNPSHYAVLDYNLNCVSNPFGTPSGINVCDCVREGTLEWSYDALLRIENATHWAPFWDSYASGYLKEMAYVLKVEGDEDFEVLDVGMADFSSSCNTTVDRDFLVDALMISTTMGLAVLTNMTVPTDSTGVAINWAGAVGEIVEEIESLISQDSVLISACDTTGVLVRRLLDSTTAGNKKSFKLSMGKRLNILLASGFHASISTKGTSKIELATSTAFKLGGTVSGGEPKDFLFRDDPRTYKTCCGQYIGNYVLGNVIPPSKADLNPVRSEDALRSELGVFFGPGQPWEDINGNPINSFPIIGTDLGETNYGLLVSSDATAVECSVPILIKRPTYDENTKVDTEEYRNESLYQVLKQMEGIRSVNVSLFSISGQLINTFPYITPAETLSHLENLPSGLYILNLQDEDQFYNFKIMKP